MKYILIFLKNDIERAITHNLFDLLFLLFFEIVICLFI